MEALNLTLGFYMFFLWYLEKLTTIYIAYIYVTKKGGFPFLLHKLLHTHYSESGKKKKEKATSNRKSITLNIWHFHFSCHLVGNVYFYIICIIMSVAYFWSVNSLICAMPHSTFSGYNTVFNHFSSVFPIAVKFFKARLCSYDMSTSLEMGLLNPTILGFKYFGYILPVCFPEVCYQLMFP